MSFWQVCQLSQRGYLTSGNKLHCDFLALKSLVSMQFGADGYMSIKFGL